MSNGTGTKPPKTSGGTTGGGPTGGGAGIRPPAVIDSAADLKKFIRNWEDMPLLSIINQLAKKGLRLTAGYYAELQDRLLKEEERTGIPVSILAGVEGPGPVISEALGTGGRGLGGDTRNYLAEQNAADAAAMERAQLSAQIDRERIAEDKRQNLLSTARQLIENRTTERSAARTQGTELAGKDPFRLTASLQGVALGSDVQTPYDIFKSQVGSVATQQIPQISPNANMADLESAIQKLSGPSGKTGVPFLGGFEGGGTANTMGPYEARLIGEAGSRIAPGTEVMITGNGQATVIPLSPGMQMGGTLDLEGDKVDWNQVSLGTYPSALQNLRRSFGVSEGPLSAQSRSRLGFFGEGGATQMGNARLGTGAGAVAPLTITPGLLDLKKAGRIDDMGVQRLSEMIGYLPNVRNAAVEFQKLSPVELEAILSLYKLAGVDSDTFNYLLKSAQIQGPARTGISLAA